MLSQPLQEKPQMEELPQANQYSFTSNLFKKLTGEVVRRDGELYFLSGHGSWLQCSSQSACA